MNITKYGYSNYYGYGVLDSVYKDILCTGLNVIAFSKSTTPSKCRLDWEPCEFVYSEPPLYVVLDGDTGKWREYFSGMIMSFPGYPEYQTHTGAFFCQNGLYNVDDNILCYDHLTITNIHECNATVFAGAIAKFTDKEIEALVRRLYSMMKDAERWKKKLITLVKEVKDDRNRKESEISSIEANLASGFGKYGSNYSGKEREFFEAHQAQKQQKKPDVKYSAGQGVQQGLQRVKVTERDIIVPDFLKFKKEMQTTEVKKVDRQKVDMKDIIIPDFLKREHS